MAFGGPLKLKGGAGVGKKKKAKKTKTNTKTMSNETDAFEQADVVEDGRAEERGGGGGKGVGPALVDRRTASERRFDAVQVRRALFTKIRSIMPLASRVHDAVCVCIDLFLFQFVLTHELRGILIAPGETREGSHRKAGVQDAQGTHAQRRAVWHQSLLQAGEIYVCA